MYHISSISLGSRVRRKPWRAGGAGRRRAAGLGQLYKLSPSIVLARLTGLLVLLGVYCFYGAPGFEGVVKIN